MAISGLSFQEIEDWVTRLGSFRVVPLCQDEAACEAIHLKICLICMFILKEIKLIFITKFLHEGSL